MRILYLAFSPKKSFDSFCSDSKTQCPWIDALIEEVKKNKDFTLAVGVPIYGKVVKKFIKDDIILYGIPYQKELNSFERLLQRITNTIESANIVNFISETIEDFSPDIIQIFGTETPFGLIAGKTRIPIVIHIQGYLTVWKGKWFSGFSKFEQIFSSSLKSKIFMLGPLKEFTSFKKRAVREEIILRNCKYFMGRTDFDKSILSILSPEAMYFHCEEFIRKDFFEKQWDFSLQNEAICVSIIKGTTYKGLDLLIEAMILLNKFYNKSVKFNICGVNKNDEIVNILKKKYRKEFTSLNIEFLGRLTTSDLIYQLCNSNFYIHPSYIENSSNGICEAMALGMPIISTNVGGASSLIKNEFEGILVQEGEPYSLAAGIVSLINNYNKAQFLGLNARKEAIQRHDPTGIANNLANIYKQILSEGKKI
jgi:glycosyltransferase involved in cell wall biosynthesis